MNSPVDQPKGGSTKALCFVHLWRLHPKLVLQSGSQKTHRTWENLVVVEPTHLKKYSLKWVHLPPNRDEHTKYLKPSPRSLWMDLAAFSTTSSNSIGAHLKSELQKCFWVRAGYQTPPRCMSKVLELSIHATQLRLEFFETDAGNVPAGWNNHLLPGLKHPNSNKTARWRPSERSGTTNFPWWVSFLVDSLWMVFSPHFWSILSKGRQWRKKVDFFFLGLTKCGEVLTSNQKHAHTFEGIKVSKWKKIQANPKVDLNFKRDKSDSRCFQSMY